ncbi:hypothetical protein BDR04DRAFT_1094426 [Suillus decipiens]|nr:hypothetical protein BDR04DRAFT_1094426 [Suillus decipiens]
MSLAHSHFASSLSIMKSMGVDQPTLSARTLTPLSRMANIPLRQIHQFLSAYLINTHSMFPTHPRASSRYNCAADDRILEVRSCITATTNGPSSPLSALTPHNYRESTYQNQNSLLIINSYALNVFLAFRGLLRRVFGCSDSLSVERSIL